MNAINLIKIEITGATVSMTSAPKPLKFLSPLYGDIKKAFETYPEGEMKVSRLSKGFSVFKFIHSKSLTNLFVI
jgi:hypothetical protein